MDIPAACLVFNNFKFVESTQQMLIRQLNTLITLQIKLFHVHLHVLYAKKSAVNNYSEILWKNLSKSSTKATR